MTRPRRFLRQGTTSDEDRLGLVVVAVLALLALAASVVVLVRS